MTNDSISFHFGADEIEYLITDSPMHLLRPIFSVLHSLIQYISELLFAAFVQEHGVHGAILQVLCLFVGYFERRICLIYGSFIMERVFLLELVPVINYAENRIDDVSIILQAN
jgi:hypothetical protein